MKILLNKSKSKNSVNITNSLATNLIGSKKLLPQDHFFDKINEMVMYNQERENCNLIRLNCVINPICSNVLFNSITEIVKNEGAPNAVQSLNYGVIDGYISREDFDNKIYCKNSDVFLYNGYKNAIRDTQISSYKCGFKYFCGLDIFNNHILRNKTFKTVCYNEMKLEEFNTIYDWMRDENGLNIPSYSYGKQMDKIHLYTNEDVLTYDDSIKENLIEKNGWFGFTNIGKFSVVDNNNETMDIFRVINYKRSCDFIQMYPTSDLWSFTPKYNPILHRLEKNWNYCLTYPSSSTTKNITFINDDINSLKIMYVDDRVRLKNGIGAFKIYSISKHGLKKGDYINFYQDDKMILKNCEVKEIENDYIFYIFNNGVKLSSLWYELTRADTDTSGVDDFFVNIPLPLSKFTCNYYLNDENGNKNEVSINENLTFTLNVPPEKILKSNVYFDSTCETNEYHGISYKITISNKTSINVEENTSPNIETRVIKRTDIDFDITLEKQDGSSYTYAISNVTANIPIRYIISSDRNMAYCGYGEDKMIYYLIDNKYVNIDDSAQNFSYKKVVDGEEVEYYVRIFSRLPNWKGCEVKVDEQQLYNDNKNLIAKYQTVEHDFENHISQLAFAKNVYGDDISQIVFSDDIDISYLRDNLGRPLTSIYLTILKNNRGYKEWYGKNGAPIQIRKIPQEHYEKYHIEYSHCFGMLNCAFRLSKESLPNIEHNNSIQINNIDSSFQYQGLDVEDLQHSQSVYRDIVNDSSIQDLKRPYRSLFKKILNDEIQYGEYIDYETNNLIYKGDTHFYGDLCAYSKKRLIEESIQQIEMRFNTAQRELSSLDKSYQYFNQLFYDEIKSDDLDKNGFVKDEQIIHQANQHKEGYCYHPHYEIPIKTFAKEISFQSSIALTLSKIDAISSEYERAMFYRIKTMNKHNLQVNDVVYMKYNSYNARTNSISDTYYFICHVADIINDKVFECRVYDENNKRINTLNTIEILSYKLFKKDNSIPEYATFSKDGSCRFIWRNVLNNGFDNETDIETYPFFNGALYVSKQINLFVKRQDPNEYTSFLSSTEIVPNVIKNQEEDNYKQESNIEC